MDEDDVVFRSLVVSNRERVKSAITGGASTILDDNGG